MASRMWTQWLATLLVALGTLLGGPVHEVLLHGSDPLVGGHSACCEAGHADPRPANHDGPEALGHGHEDHGPCGLCTLVGLRPAQPVVLGELPTGARRAAAMPADGAPESGAPERERSRGPPRHA